MTAAPPASLSPEEALMVAGMLLADARACDNPEVQQQLCFRVSTTFERVVEDEIEALRTSESKEDRTLVGAINLVLAERDDLLGLLDAVVLCRQLTNAERVSIHGDADVEAALTKLRSRVLGEQDTGIYVPLLAKDNLQARDDALLPLVQRVEEFINGDGQVMLLLGDSGAGKTTFNRHLENRLWRNYKMDDPIPFYINLPSFVQPEQDMITKHLYNLNFNADQIQELRTHRQFILICDGYDECQQLPNLYQSNLLNQKGQWRGKMLISCRSEYVGADYRNRFQPSSSSEQHTSARAFQEAVIVPFSKDQVRIYIDQYTTTSKPQWATQECIDTLNSIPGLTGLVQNPFLLTLALEALPKVVATRRDLTTVRVTRVTLYDKFIEQWLDINKHRVQAMPLSLEEDAVYQQLLEDDYFARGCIRFLKGLATSLFANKGERSFIEAADLQEETVWMSMFLSPKAGVKLLRESSPITRSGNQYRFIHRSWQEYFYSRVIYDPDDYISTSTQASTSDCEELTSSISDHPLSQCSIVKEHSVVMFLTERLKQELFSHRQLAPDLSEQVSPFKERLLELIEASKTDDQAIQAATNAMTILVRAGIRFNGADLRGIRVSGADMSGGEFDSVLLQGADLQGVNLSRSWLRQVDFGCAEMADAEFGELPFLTASSAVTSCAYSSDGLVLAMGLALGDIHVYDTRNWSRSHILRGHSRDVKSLAFSPNSHQLVSGSNDTIIRIWSADSGKLDFILVGHSQGDSAVAYSPSGKLIISSSGDMTLRGWSAETGESLFVLSGHTDVIQSVVFSPTGSQLASGGKDGSILLWEPEADASGSVLDEGTAHVFCLAYSPDGRRIVSGYLNGDLQLWSIQNCALDRRFGGHDKAVSCVAFSQSGQWIVSASYDNTVKIWDAETGILITTMNGHAKSIDCLAVSPDGLQIVTGARDCTLRLWEIDVDWPSNSSTGHHSGVSSVGYSPSERYIVSTSFDGSVRYWDVLGGSHPPFPAIVIGTDMEIYSVAYSPNGSQIATGGNDCTVRLWNPQTGVAGVVFEGQTDNVRCVAFSPCGRWIASGSNDMSVRLFNVQSGTTLFAMEGHDNNVTGVAFSTDGLQIASCSSDTTIRLWEVATGRAKAILAEHGDEVSAVAYSPDGRLLVSSSWDMTVRLWDLDTGIIHAKLEGHTDRVLCVAFSHCGQWISSSGDDKTVRLWTIQSSGSEESWSCVLTTEVSMEPINCIAWKAQSMEFVTGGDDTSVRTWRVVQDKEDNLRVCMLWSSRSDRLFASSASIQEVVGLNGVNQRLLIQYGANDSQLSIDREEVDCEELNEEKEEQEHEIDERTFFEVVSRYDTESESDMEEEEIY
ncbi:hypothetical protein BGX23_000766 [Mortierella sp. AD031]|nr:hypothetical protein BGX23_000766 [Mortierella sp. AD031]